jgi:hypothetical protein
MLPTQNGFVEFMQKTVSGSKSADKKVNPFIKLARDTERIAEAVKNNQPWLSLKDIKFLRPI